MGVPRGFRLRAVLAGPAPTEGFALADLVEWAVRVGRSTLSALGRGLRGVAAKKTIKRAWRFCDNDAVHPTDAMACVDSLEMWGGRSESTPS